MVRQSLTRVSALFARHMGALSVKRVDAFFMSHIIAVSIKRVVALSTRRAIALSMASLLSLSMALNLSAAHAADAVANGAKGTPSTSASDAATDAPLPDALLSHYRPVSGAPFFLLTDSGFTSQDIARVRVEGDPSVFSDYGGVDIAVYKIPHPLDFLKQQKDLHRIQINGDYAGDGLSNTLAFLWDKWFKKSRMVFQQLFSVDARRTVTQVAPALRQAAPASYATVFRPSPQYHPLKQFTLMDRFRYPVSESAPIAPPASLQGSSSDFTAPQNGDVYVPLGKLTPGLYLVEAYVGSHRATTLVFVSDSVAITKAAGKSMLVWAADRTSGKPVNGVDLVWTDGNGVLKTATTDDTGVAMFDRAVPAKTYTLAQDKQGGVSVSENFYYDSEIYNSKLYLFTDRPLYKPGDRVQLKVYGRTFEDARRSHPITAATVNVQLIDPAGQPLLSQALTIQGGTNGTGGDTALTLPANAYPGGYALHFRYEDTLYSAMFRVADYAKPPFDVSIEVDQDQNDTLAVGDPITGHLALRYPDGSPVKLASVDLDLKSQALSATNGDALYGARFPRKLMTKSYKADDKGNVNFTLPAASVASRYLIQAVAREEGIFPVSANRELILQPRTTQAAPQNGTSQIGANDASKNTGSRAANGAVGNTKDSTTNGATNASTAASTAAASPPSTKQAVPVLNGAITLQFDKTIYHVGDVAHVAIAFPQPVDDALLTLERDQVEAHALLSKGGDWLTLHKMDATHWRADIPVKDTYSPNMTFSVLYVGQGDFNFQNAGLRVYVPSIDLTIHTDKQDYQPGDKVTVLLTSRIGDKPAAAVISAGVVDEMVYTLQPEVAPSIFDFFYHPRRDSVRTTASLNFYSYDLAWSPVASSESTFNYNQRAFKVLTRPRRDNIDTAAWQPTLKTDANGQVSFSFIMPDSLSRWRITARAMTADGVVGQQTGSVTSSKPVYMRWTGPTHFRLGDAPRIGLIAFNTSSQAITATLDVTGLDAAPSTVTLQPGDNFIALPFVATKSTTINMALRADGKTLDRLRVPITADAPGWIAPDSMIVAVHGAGSNSGTGGDTASLLLALPHDARDIRVQRLSGSQQAFSSVIDSLLVQPQGNVDQTASQMIALTLALDGLPQDTASTPLRLTLQQRLQTARGRLMAMAGPDATFAWWGDQTAGNPLLTAYVYYADWRATQRLGITLPPEHWQRVLDVYQQSGQTLPPLQRALTLWFMQQMGLPMRTLLSGLHADLEKVGSTSTSPAMPGAAASAGKNAKPSAEQSSTANSGTVTPSDPARSVVFVNPQAQAGWQLSLLLYREMMAKGADGNMPALNGGLQVQTEQAIQTLPHAANPVLAAMATGLIGSVTPAQATLLAAQIGPNTPTMERSLALLWLQSGMPSHSNDASSDETLQMGAGWQRQSTATGSVAWRWTGSGAPTLTFVKPPASDISLRVTYDAAGREQSTLPIKLTRQLYKLVPSGKDGVFDAVKAGAVFDANALYVDQVTLTPADASRTWRYGVLQVPVPSGTQLESQRYGFQIDNLDALSSDKASSNNDDDSDAPVNDDGTPLLSSLNVLSTDRVDSSDGYYTVPVAEMKGPIVMRHLIRFGQAGRFVLPATRYYRVYDPQAKAFDTSGAIVCTLQ